MRVSIIGAGSMGGAIARGIARNGEKTGITISNPSPEKPAALKAEYPSIATTGDNRAAAATGDIVILAVKPWILPSAIAEIKDVLDYERQAVVSIAGGVSLDALENMLVKEDGSLPSLFHVIPDTAIAVGRGMTFIASRRADSECLDRVRGIFANLGEAAVVEERLMGAATALSSCGIAYAFKYVQACVQAGVQLGFRPGDALKYATATVDGAVALLQANSSTPQEEIDKVTTPGGMTIKGINSLEHTGFTSSVITAIIEPLKK